MTNMKSAGTSVPKKFRREYAAVHDNLDTLIGVLNEGVNPEQAKRQCRFIHVKYPLGILSIDQRGGGSGLTEVRLYVYPDDCEQKLYLLTISTKGTKTAQSVNVKFCTEWVKAYLSNKPEQQQ